MAIQKNNNRCNMYSYQQYMALHKTIYKKSMDTEESFVSVAS